MDLLICCRRNDGLNHNEFEGRYQVQDENAAKRKEFFTAIQNINIKRIQSFVEDEGFEMKSAKEFPSRKEAFHFLAEIDNDALTPELEENVKEIFDILLRKGCQINATDRFGNRPLMLASEKGNSTVITLLLNNGADTEKTNDYNNGPLHWASKNGQLQATELLLQRKANINAQNNKFETPLHLAVVEHKKNVVQYLIRKGADTKLVDLKKRTPLQYSRSKSMENLFKKPNGGGPGNKKPPYQSKYEDFTEPESAQYNQEFQHLYRDIDLKNVDPSVAADLEIPFSQNLKLKKHSMQALPTDDVKKCRYFSIQLKKINRKDIIKELRTRIPAGMTGTLADSKELFQDTSMDSSKRKSLTRSLCEDEKWKRLANELQISSSKFGYYNRKDDPAEAVLQEREVDLTVGELYDALFESDAGGLADEYL